MRVGAGGARIAASARDAVAGIRDGMTVGIGGALNAGHPMALVRALMQSELKDLVIASGFGGMEIDMLAGSGVARRVIAAFVGAEGVGGLPPLMRWAAENKRVDFWDIDEGLLLTALRAAAQKLPYATWRCGLGTDAVVNPLVEQAVDAPSKLPYLKVRPLEIDVCLFWAEAADIEGNVLHWGPDFGDTGFIDAAQTRIVQVERIVSTDVLRATPDRVAPWQAEVVVASPMGTYPFTSTLLRDDVEWLSAYVAAMSQLHAQGDWSAVRPALTQLLRLDGNEHAFLESVGIARLRELMA
ncbi:MAG: CoA-transferase [Burkholderiaceae bacterium]|nr:CoA-transferase [Burkholderiaceae bacterium]